MDADRAVRELLSATRALRLEVEGADWKKRFPPLTGADTRKVAA